MISPTPHDRDDDDLEEAWKELEEYLEMGIKSSLKNSVGIPFSDQKSWSMQKNPKPIQTKKMK